MQEKKLKPTEKTAKSLSDYAKYSNLAFQMIAILLVGVFGGIKLDKWLNLNFPLFTILLSLIAIGAAIYFGVKDFFKSK